MKRKYKKSAKAVVPYKRSTFPWRSVPIATAPIVGMGTSTTTVLRTSFFYNATAAASGIYTGFLAPGSCFDPTGDLSTIQPQMYDQFAAMYNRYNVNSARIRIKITGVNSAGAGTVWVGAAYPAVDSTALATYQGAACQQYAKTVSGVFNSAAVGAAAAGSGIGGEGKWLSFDLKHRAVLGDSTHSFDTGALVTANPTALQYMVLPIFLQCSSANVATFVLEVDIWQNVTFSQKKNTVDA